MKMRRRARLPVMRGAMFPHAVTGITFRWITLTTPAGQVIQIRDDIPQEQWPALLESFDRQFPPKHGAMEARRHGQL